jgi:hypothetical protein
VPFISYTSRDIQGQHKEVKNDFEYRSYSA